MGTPEAGKEWGWKMSGDLKGLRCILVVRCSTPDQIETSIEKQIEQGKEYIRRNEMILVDVKEFGGYSASLGQHYDGLNALLERKKNSQNEFNCLLLLAYDRLCRGGQSEGSRIVEAFEDVGVAIATIREGLVTGKFAWLQRGLYFEQANGYVVDLSYHTTLGRLVAQSKGKIPHSSISPFGIDKAYVAADGTWLVVVRDLEHGVRVRLDPVTLEEKETYGPGKLGFRRPPGGSILFTLGDPKRVEVVRKVFQRHYVDGWGTHRICRELNKAEIKAKRGGKWTITVIARMYANPIYLGFGFTNTTDRGVYHTGSKEGPIEHPKKRKRDMKKDDSGEVTKYMRPLPKPRDAWIRVDQAKLVAFLGDDLRALVISSIENKKSGAVAHRRRGGDRHVDSSFFLKTVLWEKHHSSTMHGQVGPKRTPRFNRTYRRYVVSKVVSCPDPSPHRKHTLKADLVEDAVLALLRQILPNRQFLEERIAGFIIQRLDATKDHREQIEGLNAEEAEVIAELKVICSLEARTKQAMSEQQHQCELRLAEIDRRRLAIKSHKPIPAEDARAISLSVFKQVKELLAASPATSPKHLRRLVEIFVPRIVFDCFAQTVELQLALPSWAMSTEPMIRTAIGVVTPTVLQCGNQAKDEEPAFLGHFRGQVLRSGWKYELNLIGVADPKGKMG